MAEAAKILPAVGVFLLLLLLLEPAAAAIRSTSDSVVWYRPGYAQGISSQSAGSKSSSSQGNKKQGSSWQGEKAAQSNSGSPPSSSSAQSSQIAQSVKYIVAVKLNVQRVDDAASGSVTVTNPTNYPVAVGRVRVDIQYVDKDTITPKDDIRQWIVMNWCGNQKLPYTLAPGAKITCWFKSNKNKYGGPISVGAGAIKPGESENSIAYIGFDSIDQVLPPSKYTYNMKEETDIPGNDISCGETDGSGGQLAYCTICGGRAQVLRVCDATPGCVGFVMQDSNCGLLKGAKGPEQPKAYSWSFTRA